VLVVSRLHPDLGEEVMAIDQPPRYVVLVWFHDGWSVSTATDDPKEAEAAFDRAQRHDKHGLRPILLDTHDLEATWTYTGKGS
jgi:hypothetical protein